MSYPGDSDILVGRTILSAKVSDDNSSIVLETDQGEVIGDCYGDCCSQTWIEHLETPAQFPMKVAAVNEVYIEEREIDYAHVKSYHTDIIAPNGERLRIEYRNSSNGYYGGSIEWGVP